jgi:hypothetical protein
LAGFPTVALGPTQAVELNDVLVAQTERLPDPHPCLEQQREQQAIAQGR